MPGVRRRSMGFAIAGTLWVAGLWAGAGTGNAVPIPAHPPLSHTPHSAAQIASRDVAVTASLAVVRTKKDMEDWLAYEAGRRGNDDARKFARSFSEARGYSGAMWVAGTQQPLVVGRRPDPETLAEVRAGVDSGEGWYVGAAREDGQGRLYCPVGLKRPSGFLVVCVSLENVQRVAAIYAQDFGAAMMLQAPGGRAVHLSGVPGAGGAAGAERHHGPVHAQAAVDGTNWHVRAGQSRAVSSPAHRDGEWIVKFPRSLTPEELARLERDSGGAVIDSDGRGAYLFRFPRPEAMKRAEGLLRARGAYYVERHGIVRTNQAPNDPLYRPYQWNMPMIDAENAWRVTTGNPRVVVAIVDTGVDFSHPDLQGQLVQGINLLDPTRPPEDDNGHGTHVAGVIAALSNNGEGVASLDWQGRVMPVKVLDQDGAGSAFDVARGIVWAVDHGANIINLSLGQTEDCQYLHDAVRYATSRGALVIAAMGNDGTDIPEYPAAYPEVLAVTAVDPSGMFAPFSNYGVNAGVAAPGVSIASTYLGGQYAALSGTSMAAPHVAGLAALIWTQNPRLTAAQVREIIERSAVDAGPPGKDPQYGYGVINVGAAVRSTRPPNWLWRIIPWWG